MKKMISVLLIASMVFSFAACSQKKEEPSSSKPSQESSTNDSGDKKKEVKTLKITMFSSWYGKGWQAIEEDVNNRAEELGFRLDFDKVADGDQGVQVLKTRAVSGDLPDLICYVMAGTLDSELRLLDKAIELTNSDWVKNYDEGLLKNCFGQGGKIYGVPLGSTNIPGMFYNEKVFKDLGVEVPKSWDDFLNICEKAKAAGITPFYVAGKDTWTAQIFAIAGMQREYKGKDVTEELTKLAANEADVRDYKLLEDTFAKLQELKNKGYIQDTWLSDTYDNQQQALVEGKTAIVCNATWIMDEIAKKYPDNINEIRGFAPVFDGEDPVGAWTPNAVYGLSTSKNADAVKAFLDYFGSPETQKIYFDAQPGIPVVKGLDVAGLPQACKDLYDEYTLPGRGQVLWQSAPVKEGVISVSVGDYPSYTMDALLGEKTTAQIMQDIRDFMEKDGKTKGAAGW